MPAHNRRKRGATGPKNGGIGRAIRYLGRYRRDALLPYLFMIIATLAQLAVPRMVRNIIDAVTNGVIANAIVPQLDQFRPAFCPQSCGG